MIWMGVGRPEDFVAPINRFPVHSQCVTMHSNARFVAILTESLAVSTVRLFLHSSPYRVEIYSTIGDYHPLLTGRTWTVSTPAAGRIV